MLLILAFSPENKKRKGKKGNSVSGVSHLGGDFTGKYISKRTLKSSKLDSGAEQEEAAQGGRKSWMILLSGRCVFKRLHIVTAVRCLCFAASDDRLCKRKGKKKEAIVCSSSSENALHPVSLPLSHLPFVALFSAELDARSANIRIFSQNALQISGYGCPNANISLLIFICYGCCLNTTTAMMCFRQKTDGCWGEKFPIAHLCSLREVINKTAEFAAVDQTSCPEPTLT